MKSLGEQTPYEILEVPPGCSPAEVERGYLKAKAAVGPDALAAYALADERESGELLKLIEEAHTLLADGDKRRAYDTEHGLPASGIESGTGAESVKGEGERVGGKKAEPESAKAEAAKTEAAKVEAEKVETQKAEAAEAEAVKEVPKASSPSSPDGDHKPVRRTEAVLPPDSPVTGEALRRVREALGLSLQDLEKRTKIGRWHLDNIEREKFTELPAHVYLRGFLSSLARELRLDPTRVTKSYLEQMRTKSKPPE